MMPKQVGVTFDDEVYSELRRRAGGERKISKYLNPLLRTVFAAQPEPDPARLDLAALQEQLRHLQAAQESLQARVALALQHEQ